MNALRPPAVLALALALAACAVDDKDDVEPVVRAFELTAPEGAIELVPVAGDAADLTWTFDAEHAELVDVVIAAESTSGGASSQIAWADLPAGTARYVVPPGGSGVLPLPPPIPPDVYRVTGHAYGGGSELATSAASGLLVMQGATFRDAELTFTADVSQRDIWMTTVTATVARATVYLTTIAEQGRWVISQGTIASDLAPVGRVVTFTGRTIDDVEIPAGDYRVLVEMSARGGTVTYLQRGLTIHWQP